MAYKPFKMKGHTLPGINQKSEGNTDLPDGRSGSSPFQDTKYFGQNTSWSEVDAVTTHNKKHGDKVWDADHKPIVKENKKKSPVKFWGMLLQMAPQLLGAMGGKKKEEQYRKALYLQILKIRLWRLN